MATPWMREIETWFGEHRHVQRLEKVLGYTGCRELWLQAELAMWLEHKGLLDANGDWDTNLRIAKYGRCDLAVRHPKRGYELALEVKVLGSSYQTKVLRGGGGFKRFATDLESRGWRVRPHELTHGRGFGLMSDFMKLRDLGGARDKVLLLVINNPPDEDTLLGRALANIEFPLARSKTVHVSKSVLARMWRL